MTTPSSASGCRCGPGSRPRWAARPPPSPASPGRATARSSAAVIGLRLAPDLLSLLAAGRQVVLVTGTNGKTTTTKLITAALAPLGGEIASNIYGANMEAGLTSALSRAPDARVAVLETDEKYIPAMIKATKPKVVVLLNLSRDQMDRAAEIWLLARRWREALANAPGLPGGGQRRRPAGRLGGELGAGRSPGWRRASAGARTPGAARTAAPTCSATGTTGPARNAACGGRR